MPEQVIGTDNNLVEKIFNQLSSSVAIALLNDGKLTYEFYGGRMSEQKVSRATRFNIGTASALATTALTVKMMEFGVLKLTDRVRRVVPEFQFDDVTVYHLLTHTSGLRVKNIPLPDNSPARAAYFQKLYADCSVASPPGNAFAENSYDHDVLADVVERVAGESLRTLASSLLFEPLGMKNTVFSGAGFTENQLVIPWTHRENRFMHELRSKLPTGHNGLFTTAPDLLRFGKLFLCGGEAKGRQVFLESSIEFMLKDITGGKYHLTPVFTLKADKPAVGCFSGKLSPGSAAITGDTGTLLFIDRRYRTVGAALTNSTWVHDVGANYRNIGDILMSI